MQCHGIILNMTGTTIHTPLLYMKETTRKKTNQNKRNESNEKKLDKIKLQTSDPDSSLPKNNNNIV